MSSHHLASRNRYILYLRRPMKLSEAVVVANAGIKLMAHMPVARKKKTPLTTLSDWLASGKASGHTNCTKPDRNFSVNSSNPCHHGMRTLND